MDNSSLNITPEQIKSTKQIGKLHGDPVFHLLTKGGLNILILKGKKIKALSTAPHKAIAKKWARDNEPDIEFDELSKSEEETALFDHLKPRFNELTDTLNSKF